MKRPQWLTRRTVLISCGLAIVLGGAIALGYRFKCTGFGADETVVTSKKTIERDNQGNVITEKTVTTTPQEAKKFWDWLSLLVVPASLALLGAWLQYLQQQRANKEQHQIEVQRNIAKQQADAQLKQEKETSEKIAAENRREEALQVYFDRISTLLVDKNLLAIAQKQAKISAEGDEATSEEKELSVEEKELLDVSIDVIRARTLSILRVLVGDAERKTSLIRFLLEAEVISKLKLNLSDADLRDANLFRADLRNATLSMAKLSNAKLSWATLRDADLSSADLRNANLRNANLSSADISNAKLSWATLRDADLSSADLRNANLSNAKLSWATLRDANLRNADLSSADLRDANLRNADLSSADLRDANLCYVSLEHACLCGARANNAKLRKANLFEADLGYVDLSHADLSHADLSEAILGGVDFSRTILLATDLRTAIELTEEAMKGESAPFLCNVGLPKEIRINPDRDCKCLPEVLLKKYPSEFKSIEEAEAYVEKAKHWKWH